MGSIVPVPTCSPVVAATTGVLATCASFLATGAGFGAACAGGDMFGADKGSCGALGEGVPFSGAGMAAGGVFKVLSCEFAGGGHMKRASDGLSFGGRTPA